MLLGGKVRNRLLLVMGLAAALPLSALAVFSFTQIRINTTRTVEKLEAGIYHDLLHVQQIELANRALLVDDRLHGISSALSGVRSQAEAVFAEPARFPDGGGLPELTRIEGGAAWTPLGSGASVYLSSRSGLTKPARDALALTGYLEPPMMQVVSNYPEVAATYVLLKETVTRMVPGVDFSQLVKAGMIPADMNAPAYNFYYQADQTHNPSRNVVWTDPYVDLTPRGLIVTATAPIDLPDGEMRGVMAADVRVEDIANRLLDVDFKEVDAFALLLNRNGRLIAATRPAQKSLASELKGGPTEPAPDLLHASNPTLRQAVVRVVTEDPGIQQITMGNREWYILHAKIPSARWSLAYFIPSGELLQDARMQAELSLAASSRQLTMGYLAGALVVAVAMASLVYWLSNRFTSPIHQLTEAVSALEQGREEVAVEDRDDEFGVLNRTFKQMAETLRTKQTALSAANLELSSWNHRLEKEVADRTAKLQDLYQRSRQADQARRNLLARVSHELRTPVASILGYVEGLADGLAATEAERQEHLQVVRNKAVSISHIIDDLFLLARFETGQVPMAFEHLPATGLLADAVNQILGDVQRAGLRLVTDIPDNLPDVWVDAQRIGQVLNNLVQNAIRYSPPDGQISVTARYEDGMVVVTVSDQGSGIDPADLPHVFEEFFRGRNQPGKGPGGTGLGLAIASEIMAAHGAWIRADGRRGSGSRFSFAMPLDAGGSQNEPGKNPGH